MRRYNLSQKITYPYPNVTIEILVPENADITDILFLADLELQHQTSLISPIT